MLEFNQINRAKELEKELSNYRLWANMIPKTSWYTNLRTILPEDEWVKIRKLVYNHFNYRCAICKSKGQLHAHESWIYDYENSKQLLKDILALCYLCHMTQHLGFVQVKLITAGELTMEQIEDHWLSVNDNTTHSDFGKMVKNAFELWDLRSLTSWDVYDQNGVLLSEL